MTYRLLFISIIVLFSACSRKHEAPKFISGLPVEEEVNNRVLVNLKNSDPVAWQTITGVMDTVKYYRCQLESWPEQAVGQSIESFWAQRENGKWELNLTLSKPLVEFIRDTMRVNGFRDFMHPEDYSSWDEIYQGDFKIVNYQYLNKKYVRLIRDFTQNSDIYVGVCKAQPLWDKAYDMFKLTLDSVMLGPQPYLLRDHDNLVFLSQICENRLYSISEFYLLLADSSYQVPSNESIVTMNEVMVSYERCLSKFKHPSQVRALRGLHSRWSQWFAHRSDMQHSLNDGDAIEKYYRHLDNLIYNQYDFYEKLYEYGYVYDQKGERNELSDRRKRWESEN